MTQNDVRKLLMDSFNHAVSFREVKPNTYQIFLPYYHLDWDMIDIFLCIFWDKIIISDFWQTLMRLSYYIDTLSSSKKKVLDAILATYTVKCNEKFVLSIEVDDSEKLYPCMMEMIAVITKISDISFLKQERAKNMFYEEFDKFMMEDVREKTNVSIDRDFSPQIDSKWSYPVPYKLNTKVPIFVFPVSTNEKCLEAVATLLFYANHNFNNKSISIFRDNTEILDRNYWKLVDLSDRPLSIFDSANREKMINFALSCIEAM